MRILHVATHGAVTRGGAVQMARLVAALATRGHKVKAVFNGERVKDVEGASILEERGVEVTALPLESLGLGPMLALRRIVLKEGFQLVHTHRDLALRFAFLSLWGTGISLVAQRGTTYRPKGMVPFILRSKAVARVVAVAHAVKKVLVEEGIPEEKVVVVYGSVDTARFHPDVRGEKIKEELVIPFSFPVVGMVAALVGKKGYPLFLEACRMASEKLKALHVLMVGRGKPSKFSKDVAPLGNMAHFTGHRDDVEMCIAAMDVVVCASTKGEGLTGSLREAMAMARPVVSTEVSGNPEAVIHGKTGLLVPVGDGAAMATALISLLSNPLLARKLGSNGRRLALKIFPDNRRAQIVETLYREVMA